MPLAHQRKRGSRPTFAANSPQTPEDHRWQPTLAGRTRSAEAQGGLPGRPLRAPKMSHETSQPTLARRIDLRIRLCLKIGWSARRGIVRAVEGRDSPRTPIGLASEIGTTVHDQTARHQIDVLGSVDHLAPAPASPHQVWTSSYLPRVVGSPHGGSFLLTLPTRHASTRRASHTVSRTVPTWQPAQAPPALHRRLG